MRDTCSETPPAGSRRRGTCFRSRRDRGKADALNPSAVTSDQIIDAAEITRTDPDFAQLEPVARAALRDLRWAGVSQTPTTILADAGYWHTEQMERIISVGMQVLVPPDSGLREGARPGWDGGFYTFMRRVLQSGAGHALYKKRKGVGLIVHLFGMVGWVLGGPAASRGA